MRIAAANFVMLARLGFILGILLAAAPLAQAEGPSTAKPRVGKVGLRVLEVYGETQQALVLDKQTGRHVVVSEGERIGKYQIIEIGDDQVVVQQGAREIVLVAETPTASVVAPAPVNWALLDPYSPTLIDDVSGLLDPYAPVMITAPSAPRLGVIDAHALVREVLAPSQQRASTIDPYGATPPLEAVPVGPAPVGPAPVVLVPVVPVPAPVVPVPAPAPVAPAVETIRAAELGLQRGELSAALADFDRLHKDLGFLRTGRGVQLTTVPAASYAHRLGLRAGDVITAIDGAPIRSLDDAAGVYVRLLSAKKLAVEVDRGSTHGTLKFALK